MYHAVNISFVFFFSNSLMVTDEQLVISTKEEECLVRDFLSNGVSNPRIDWVLSQANLLTRII